MDLTSNGYGERFDYRVDVLARRNRMVASAGGDVIAESSRSLVVDEQNHGLVVYFPRDDVRMDLLAPIEHVTYCPFKGRAAHWRLASGSDEPVAWSYEEPYPEVARIAGYVAFYQDRVAVQLGVAARQVPTP